MTPKKSKARSTPTHQDGVVAAAFFDLTCIVVAAACILILVKVWL